MVLETAQLSGLGECDPNSDPRVQDIRTSLGKGIKDARVVGQIHAFGRLPLSEGLPLLSAAIERKQIAGLEAVLAETLGNSLLHADITGSRHIAVVDQFFTVLTSRVMKMYYAGISQIDSRPQLFAAFAPLLAQHTFLQAHQTLGGIIAFHQWEQQSAQNTPQRMTETELDEFFMREQWIKDSTQNQLVALGFPFAPAPIYPPPRITMPETTLLRPAIGHASLTNEGRELLHLDALNQDSIYIYETSRAGEMDGVYGLIDGATYSGRDVYNREKEFIFKGAEDAQTVSAALDEFKPLTIDELRQTLCTAHIDILSKRAINGESRKAVFATALAHKRRGEKCTVETVTGGDATVSLIDQNLQEIEQVSVTQMIEGSKSPYGLGMTQLKSLDGIPKNTRTFAIAPGYILRMADDSASTIPWEWEQIILQEALSGRITFTDAARLTARAVQLFELQQSDYCDDASVIYIQL